jgi:hypothetical protein
MTNPPRRALLVLCMWDSAAEEAADVAGQQADLDEKADDDDASHQGWILRIRLS